MKTKLFLTTFWCSDHSWFLVYKWSSDVSNQVTLPSKGLQSGRYGFPLGEASQWMKTPVFHMTQVPRPSTIIKPCCPCARDGSWPDPTQAYIWPAVNKRPTFLWPRYFLTRPEDIFFDSKGKKLKNLTFLGEILQTQTINGWPNPTGPEPQKIDSDPSLHICHLLTLVKFSTWLLFNVLK